MRGDNLQLPNHAWCDAGQPGNFYVVAVIVNNDQKILITHVRNVSTDFGPWSCSKVMLHESLLGLASTLHASCTLHFVRRSPLVQLRFLANRRSPWLCANTLLCQRGKHGLLSTAPFALMQVLKLVVLWRLHCLRLSAHLEWWNNVQGRLVHLL